MTHVNYVRLFLIMLLLIVFNQVPLLAQIATHRLGAPVSLHILGQNTSVNFVQRYVLTNAAGIIQYTTNTLPFTGVAAGQYKAYSINYDQTQTAPTLTVGTAINAIGGACVNTSAALPIGILDCNNTTGNITPSIAGQNLSASFTQKYILTDSIGQILQITNTPQYMGLSNGIYNVYAINYETTTGITGLTVGQNKGGITGACISISQPLGYVVCRPSVEIAGNGIDDDGDGLIDCHDSDVTACTCTTTSSITFGISGQNTTTGFTTKYVLTDSFGLIKQVVNTPSVSGLTDGKYRIYSVNYETATGITGLTIGQSISNITGTCVAKSLPLIYKVCLVGGEICGNSIDDDGDGKIDCEDSDCTLCNCTTISDILYNAPTTDPSPNHTRRYVLTDDNGVIQKVTISPLFIGCTDGQYRVYTVWYVPTTFIPPLSIGSNISAISGASVVVSLPKLEKVCSPSVQYETRILQKDYDCLNKKLTIQVQVRAKPNTGTFLMGDANYRFDYNSKQLTNPSIVSQEHFSNIAPASDADYLPQSLNGSSEGPTIGTVSLNTIYGGGGLTARTVDSVWQTVSCIQFDKQDTALCYSFRWHDNLENPSTGMTGILLSGGGAYNTFDVKSGGYYGNLQQCLSSLNCCISLDIKVILEGPYNTTTGLMSTALNDRGLLPGQTPIGVFAVPTPSGQPFNTSPWNYFGTESITSYPATVVDWVLVSLRTDSTTALSTVFRKAGLLHNDGHVTFIDSCWGLTIGHKYFVVVEHRNHIGVMSNMGFTAQLRNVFDFTTGDGYIRTNPPTTGQKQIGSKWVMLAGDGRKDLQVMNYDINFSDQQRWKGESGVFDQYRYSDFNFDADTNFLDSNIWKKNNGRYSGVPH